MSAIGGRGGSRIKKHPLEKTPSVIAAENAGDDDDDDDTTSSSTLSTSTSSTTSPQYESESEKQTPHGSVS
jgi:hypothetical protein